MFTGLIQQVGRAGRLTPHGPGFRLDVTCDEPWDTPLTDGESVAVHGICLTVVAATARSFCCDVLHETLAKTNLASRSHGARLNLERAMAAGDRFGGHMVSGHVDGTGPVLRIEPASDNDRELVIGAGPDMLAGIVEKGSVACDGVSLTVTMVSSDAFAVRIIPFTWAHTALSALQPGDLVNLETDMVGKSVRRHLDGMPRETRRVVDMALLRRAGFAPDDG